MYFYTKLITIFNSKSNFHNSMLTYMVNPEKEKKRFSNPKLNRDHSIILSETSVGELDKENRETSRLVSVIENMTSSLIKIQRQ
ncbi:hypothetical protein J2772_000122 [Chryseobacterium jejuense]|nr:hypothetical protein [Chryseobacterium jejuense]